MKVKNVLPTVLFVTLGLIGSTFLSGCGSSIKKADIANTANPATEIERLQAEVNEGYASHYDVLANDDFSQSLRYLEKAKAGLKNNRNQEVILDNVAYSQAYLDRAKGKANDRKVKAQGVLEARSDALSAGVRRFPELAEKMSGLDSELRGIAGNLDNKSVAVLEVSQIQKGYQDLELAAIQTTLVGSARAMVAGAINSDARSRVPNTLRAAELDVQNAENTIRADRHRPESYEQQVKKANQSAQFLLDVLAVTKRKGESLREDDAIKMVRQNYEIRRLKGQVGQAEGVITEMDRDLGQTEQELETAKEFVGLHEALEEARNKFTNDEAEVFQQGDKLLIRLKSMAFPSGRADLPAQSLAILSKVKSVAAELNPAEIEVEGHTDSTGNAKINQTLSEKRASAVAEYLKTTGLHAEKMESVGYGFSRPIATNKSAKGRAQNRRVDIVITPGPQAAAEADQL